MVTSIKLSSYEVASNLRQFLIELLGGDALIQLSCFKDGMKLFELRESLRFRGTKKGGEKVPGARKIGLDNPKQPFVVFWPPSTSLDQVLRYFKASAVIITVSAGTLSKLNIPVMNRKKHLGKTSRLGKKTQVSPA